MHVSDECVAFIKTAEGFSKYPYFDHTQYTVGYGTQCPDDKYQEYKAEGISQEDAEALLRLHLEKIEETLHKKLISSHGLTFTQGQYDALVSFTYNIGTGWLYGTSTMRTAILQQATGSELVNAFVVYSKAGGEYLTGLVKRRLCEANMYLNGVYSNSADKNFGYVFYDSNCGSNDWSVQGFLVDSGAKPVSAPYRDDGVFLGWFTDWNGGQQVTALSRDLVGKTLFAHWTTTGGSEAPQAQTVTVTGDVVNIRSGPGTNYDRVRQVRKGDTLTVSYVTSLSGLKWGKLQDGWICLTYTNYKNLTDAPSTPPSGNTGTTGQDSAPASPPAQNQNQSTAGTSKPVSGTVNVSDALRVRSGPGTNYPVVGHLYNRDRVEISQQKTVGDTVWGNTGNGWVCLVYVTLDSSAAPAPADKEPAVGNTSGSNSAAILTGTVNASNLRIRSAPGFDTSVLGYYNRNDSVKIYEKVWSGSICWGKTDRGWISMDYVVANNQAANPGSAPSNKIHTVTADCLRVRGEAGLDQKIVGFLYYGDTVEILETKTVSGSDWGRVSQGWISLKYVTARQP